MKTIYISHLATDLEMKEVLEDWPAVGIETIEFGVGDNLDVLERTAEKYRMRMGRWLAERPFSVHGPFLDLNPGSYDSLIREATMVRFRQAYEGAAMLKADRILFHTGFVPETCYETGWPDKAAEFWKRFLDEKGGEMPVHLENVLDLHWETAAYILDKVNCPYFTACVDIGHAAAYSKQSPLEWLSGLGSRIGHLHLHDNDGKEDLHQALGKGKLPLKQVLQMAEACCPEASVTIENTETVDIRESLLFLNQFL